MKHLCKIILAAAMPAFPMALYAQGNTPDYALPEIVWVSGDIRPPDVLLKSNLALLGIGVANVGGEFRLNPMLSLDVPLVYSPYTWSRSWSVRVLAIQPELRYWLDRPFSGHFFGIHVHTGFFSVAVNSRTRYQDRNGDTPMWGLGVSYGYSLPLRHRLGLEFTVGAGYARIWYDAYYNVPNGARYDTAIHNYWGITRLGVSLFYSFNRR